MSRRRHHRGSRGGSEAPARAVPAANRYRAALIGCGRMGAFIDNEGTSPHAFPTPLVTSPVRAPSWWRCPTRAPR